MPGNKLELVGQVPLEAKRFEVNLKTEDGRILLHVNPRLDQEKVVLNSNIKKWGSEEIPDLFPFAPGAHFSLVVSKNKSLFIFTPTSGM